MLNPIDVLAEDEDVLFFSSGGAVPTGQLTVAISVIKLVDTVVRTAAPSIRTTVTKIV